MIDSITELFKSKEEAINCVKDYKDHRSNNFVHIMMKNIEASKKSECFENLCSFFGLDNNSSIYDMIKGLLDEKNRKGHTPLGTLFGTNDL